MYKLAVIGSRDFKDYDLVKFTLDKIKDKIELIVSGGAEGADSLAEWWADENDIPTKIFIPDWTKHGKKAGFLRNVDIIDTCDACIAFWDGRSRGTEHSINLCVKKDKPLRIIRYKTLDPF